MEALETASATAEPVSGIAARFMTEAACYERGAELGFEGVDFYVAGRGGVLGDVDADQIISAFVYFAPDMIRAAWERGRAVMPPDQAAREFAAVAHAWGREHLDDDLEPGRVAELCGRVADAATIACAPLFAGWRRLDEPDDPRELAIHRLNGLRELRGARHAAAIVSTGLQPVEALAVRTPHMGPIFGWEELPDVSSRQDPWNQAEEATDRALAPAFAALDADERSELVDLLARLQSSLP